MYLTTTLDRVCWRDLNSTVRPVMKMGLLLSTTCSWIGRNLGSQNANRSGAVMFSAMPGIMLWKASCLGNRRNSKRCGWKLLARGYYFSRLAGPRKSILCAPGAPPALARTFRAVGRGKSLQPWTTQRLSWVETFPIALWVIPLCHLLRNALLEPP